MVNACSQYTKHRDIQRFCSDVEEISNNFAHQFYGREFTDDQMELINTSDGVENCFKTFSETGNIVLYKNQLQNLIKHSVPEQKPLVIFSALQSLSNNEIQLSEPKNSGSPMKPRKGTNSFEFSQEAPKLPSLTIPKIFAMIQQLQFLTPAHKEHINHLISNEDPSIYAVAEVYMITHDHEDFKENLETMLKVRLRVVFHPF